MSSSVRRRELERVLFTAERAIALLDRCRPDNAHEERLRLCAALRRGEILRPRWRYKRGTDLTEICGLLQMCARGAAAAGPWGELYAARAEELYYEALAATAVGSAAIAGFAQRRFRMEDDDDARMAAAAAQQWANLEPEALVDETILSDDEQNERSLVSRMKRAVGEHRLPFRVVIVSNLASAAATGDGVIVVRSGDRHDTGTVERIVAHEVLGHALPRYRARQEECGLFALGTAGGADDEEGRALLIEERMGRLDSSRRRELGRRHLAALSARAGASFMDTVLMLLGLGCVGESAVSLASRAHRGGGLAREVVYLVALLRVRRTLSMRPADEAWLERGRIAVALVPLLERLGTAPDVLRFPHAA